MIKHLRVSLSLERNTREHFTNGAVIHSKSLVNDIFSTYPDLERTSHFSVEPLTINDNIGLSFDFVESLIK